MLHAMANNTPVCKPLLRTYVDRDNGQMCTFFTDLGAPGHPAAIVDPVAGLLETPAQMLREMGLKLEYILQTHVPIDYKSGATELKKLFPEAAAVASKASGAQADILVEGGDTLKLGNVVIKILATPGYTKGCVTYVTGDGPGQIYPPYAFTGLSLLVRGKGNTDHEGGDAEELAKSVHTQIFKLHRNTHLIPSLVNGRSGYVSTTVREEMAFNPYFRTK